VSQKAQNKWEDICWLTVRRPSRRCANAFGQPGWNRVSKMAFIITLDVAAVAALVLIALVKGFEHVLPVAAFLLMLFPEESKIPIPGLFDLTSQRLITITLIILCCISRKPVNRPPEKLPLKLGILMLTFWWLLSAGNSVVFSISLKAVLSQVYDFFAVYYIYWKYVSTTNTVKKILGGMVAGIIVCSVLGAIEAYSSWSVLSLFPLTAHRFGDTGVALTNTGPTLRAQSTFGHPILFGGALALTIPMAFYLLSVTEGLWRKVLLWAGTFLMFLCLYKTGSRGPWLACGFSLGVLAVFCPRNIRRYVVMIALLTMTVLVVRPGIWDTILNTYRQTQDPESLRGVSYQWRYALFRIANRELSKSASRAVWGYGPESFYYLHLTGEFQGQIVPFESCDSSVAELMIETGYGGFLIAAMLLLGAAARAYRKYRELPAPLDTPCMVFFVIMVAFCFLMTNAAIFGWGQQTYILWIVIALSCAYPSLVKAKNPNREQSEAWERAKIGDQFLGASQAT
jgi:O-antigen ligase/polysaccharide polymerase Wzy-like membrane protein